MAKDKQNEVLFEEGLLESAGPVECLGMTFDNDDARREYFLGILKEKLKDPEFRKLEGFPIGEDENILALSDPPYYTACPNPFIEEFIKQYGKTYCPKTDDYNREPFAADIAIARHDDFTTGHTYHTKVPPLAIVQYINHYTNREDVVLDFFCGSGMTGIAAAGCDLSKDEAKPYLSASHPRRALLIDLCPAATHIAHGYTSRWSNPDIEIVRSAINEVVEETNSLYHVEHSGNKSRAEAWRQTSSDQRSETLKTGILDYLVWSEVFICPFCSGDIIFGEVAYDPIEKKVSEKFKCPNCGSVLQKRNCTRKKEEYFDQLAMKREWRPLTVPIFTAYSTGGQRFYRRSVIADTGPSVELSKQVFPELKEVMKGERYYKDGLSQVYGIKYIHQFYTERNLLVLSKLMSKARELDYSHANLLRFTLTSIAIKTSKLMNYNADGVGRVMKGTLYESSLIQECNPAWLASLALRDITKLCSAGRHARGYVAIATQSATKHSVPDDSIDYVWVDPPFGKNLMYAELNQLWEWWLGLFSADNYEAVIDEKRGKDLAAYSHDIYRCFLEAHRVLKPGRWMTVVFHNSKNAVWNAIQESLTKAGFVVADVRALDKKLMTYKQSQQGLVRVDLIISAYKPNSGLEERFKLEAGTEEGAWDFIRTHLKQLPVFVSIEGKAEVVAERQNYLLFDRMVAFHVQRGVTVPLSAGEFYAGLIQRFPERDGMFFLPEQTAEYDKKRMKVGEVVQLELFVTDESSAIQWIKQQLTGKPQTFPELHPEFMKEIAGWEKHEKPLELLDLLNENFLLYDGTGDVPPQIHSYMSSNYEDLHKLEKDDPVLKDKAKGRYYVPDPNKAQDLEKLRERSLLKEFEEYRQAKTKKLKIFRVEAVRAGFKKAWQERDYDTIIDVAEKIPESVLQDDAKLLMWYDQARTRAGTG